VAELQPEAASMRPKCMKEHHPEWYHKERRIIGGVPVPDNEVIRLSSLLLLVRNTQLLRTSPHISVLHTSPDCVSFHGKQNIREFLMCYNMPF